jgi:D-alanyl-D-alanine carboxypeptidase
MTFRLTRTCSLALIGLVPLLFSPMLASADPSPSSPAVRAAIDAVVAKERAAYGGRSPIPAVLIGVWTPSGSYVRAYGYADLATRRPLTDADHFRIGSNTKTFVISVLLQLVDEGYLSLDDPIGKFSLGIRIPNGGKVTVRDLCLMRSGFVDAYNTPQINKMHITGSMVVNPATLVTWAVNEKPLFAPGTKYNYSNTNYLLLGMLIEAITHDTVAHQIQTRLIDRFDLHETSYPANQAMPSPWPHGYALDKNKNWEDVSGTIPVSLMGSAGEMISDMHDMVRWTKLYVTGKTSGAATQRDRMNCVYTGEGNISFGLGIGCSGGYFGYTGGLPGYNTANYYMPKTDTMILAWVTMQTEDPPPGAANAFLRGIANIMTPSAKFFTLTNGHKGRSGL